MGTIGIICTVIGTILAIIGGVSAAINYIFKKGMAKEHLANFEKTVLIEFAKIDQHFEGFEKTTERNFNRLEKQLNVVDERFNKIEKRLEDISDTVTNHTYTLMSIGSFLDNKFPKNKIKSYMKKSPRQLTETGKKMLDMVNGRQFLSDNKEQLFKIIDSYHPKTKLDVQNVSMMALLYYTTTDAFNNIKDIIYDMPEMETDEGKYEITLNDICFVMSLPLRDMYIIEHNMK